MLLAQRFPLQHPWLLILGLSHSSQMIKVMRGFIHHHHPHTQNLGMQGRDGAVGSPAPAPGDTGHAWFWALAWMLAEAQAQQKVERRALH